MRHRIARVLARVLPRRTPPAVCPEASVPAEPLPVRRRPYRDPGEPLDGDASALVRPYVLAHERTQQRDEEELLRRVLAGLHAWKPTS